jgi:hypothetical protein
MKKLVLHIGMEKTGSTSIQTCLDLNQKKLAALGILYPQLGKVSAHHYELAHLKQDPGLYARELAAEADDYETIIVSSEHFSRASTETRVREYQELFRDYDVTVVCYLRDPLSWLVSLFGEHIKWGGSATIDEFFRRSSWKFNYALFFDRWTTAFGTDSFTCYNYADYPNVVEHFLELAVGPVDLNVSYNANRSDSTAFLEIVRRLNGGFPELDTRAVLTELRAKLASQPTELPDYAWPIRPVVVDSLARQRELFNARLGRDFFDLAPYGCVEPREDQEQRLADATLRLLAASR